MAKMDFPPWVVLHFPHDSIVIPPEVRGQYLLDDAGLALELERMTDHFTAMLFVPARTVAAVVRAPVSRLVVDVERFEDDGQEPMAKRGMGVIYTSTSGLQPLRRPLQAAEREHLLAKWYRPHHAKLEAAVTSILEAYGKCLVIDCHSFPDEPLPYELVENSNLARPEICIGTDSYHTPTALRQGFVEAFENLGFRVAVDDPFAGALVPASRYRCDARVAAVMVEVNRAGYLCDGLSERASHFPAMTWFIRKACLEAIDAAYRTQEVLHDRV